MPMATGMSQMASPLAPPSPNSNFKRTHVTAALIAIAIALILNYAPGFCDDDWSSLEPTTATQNNNNNNKLSTFYGNNETTRVISFTGGRDNTTNLVGTISLPTKNKEGNDNDADADADDLRLPPVIVLAHGLGLAADCSLDKFTSAFNAEGFATFAFDYATFGRSGGLPRHVVDPVTHISDLKRAIATLHRKSDELKIDGDRIALWGTSLGGGHVVSAALQLLQSSNANDDDRTTTLDGEEEEEGIIDIIKAVVSQVPHLASGLESISHTVASDPATYVPALCKTLGGMTKGALLRLLRGRPWYLPLHGLPGSAAAMQNAGDDEGYGSLCPAETRESGLWKNALTSDGGLRIMFYRPLNAVSSFVKSNNKITKRRRRRPPPVLFVAAEGDTLCPAKYVERAAERIEGSEYVLLENAGHFDIYSGELLEEMLRREIAFFKKHLL